MSRLPHCLGNLLTDDRCLTRRPHFTPRKIPGTHFCYRLCRSHCHSVAGRIRSIEKSNELIRNRTWDLPACSTVPYPLRYSVSSHATPDRKFKIYRGFKYPSVLTHLLWSISQTLNLPPITECFNQINSLLVPPIQWRILAALIYRTLYILEAAGRHSRPISLN
jgi:hypothetical protein